ncbi:hypothetical protein ACFL96_10700 [Thermoproteota archaeon]
MTKKPNLEEVIYVSWEESERGWGTRPDGCSLHLTHLDFDTYLDAYWKRMPDTAPDEYERPAGDPVPVYVTKKLYQEIKESENGIRLYAHNEREVVKEKKLVYSQRRSGWVPVEV